MWYGIALPVKPSCWDLGKNYIFPIKNVQTPFDQTSMDYHHHILCKTRGIFLWIYMVMKYDVGAKPQSHKLLPCGVWVGDLVLMNVNYHHI